METSESSESHTSHVLGTRLDAANSIVPLLIDAIDKDPALGDKVRFCLIDFAKDAQVQVPLCDIRSISSFPTLESRDSTTSYAAAFRKLRELIEVDAPQLRSDDTRVTRPTVWFLTDGECKDDPYQLALDAFTDLTDPTFEYAPNVIPWGVGEATKDMVQPFVNGHGMRSFVPKDRSDPAEAIHEMANLLIASIIESAAAGRPVLAKDPDSDSKYL